MFVLRAVLVLAAIFMVTRPSGAEHFRLAIASDDDLYIGEILKFALEKQGGGHTMEVVRIAPMAQGRALRMLEARDARFDVLYSGYTEARAGRLAIVAFPLTRGMLGYRLLAVRDDRVGLLKPDITFQQLQSKVCFGAGTDWPDARIMRDAGLCVVTGTDESLWAMLVRGRYDAFPRGLIEVVSEIERERNPVRGVTLTLDPSVMLAYKQDLFFYLPKQAAERAAIIQDGLEKGHADGSYDQFFYSIPTIKAALADIQAHQRTTFHLGDCAACTGLAAISEDHWHCFEDKSAFASHLTGSGPQTNQ
ncbi:MULTISPECIES: hypothetical protein [Kordiimonas]|jgi:hypothetical protein|uniref:hypothetical protein n=1 Tax=Kordiimonas TaxID=288021 RepID=UPI00257C0DEF|nr:hypothetical protein [Kordiimonas sp. UBA4487]